jgi:hypothetical protein
MELSDGQLMASSKDLSQWLRYDMKFAPQKWEDVLAHFKIEGPVLEEVMKYDVRELSRAREAPWQADSGSASRTFVHPPEAEGLRFYRYSTAEELGWTQHWLGAVRDAIKEARRDARHHRHANDRVHRRVNRAAR